MFMLAYCLLCLVNPLLASPVRPFKDSNLQSASLSGQADYPDLTNGLTDAEVQETLQDLTLEDLRSLDNLLNDHINHKEDGSKASLRTELRQANEKSFRALDSALDESCRDEEDDVPKPVLCTKRPTCSTTKHCIKKTSFVPKTTRTIIRPVTNCKPKTTYGPIDDDFGGEPKCPKVKPKIKCKPKEETDCASDDFMCLAKKQLDKDKIIFQEQEALAAEAPGRKLAGIKKMREESIPSRTAQGEPLDFLKGSRLKANSGQSELHANQASWEREPLAKLHQDQHDSFEGEHQTHLEQANVKLQHKADQKLEHQANLEQEPQANLQPQNVANLHQNNWANVEQDNWANVPQNHWVNVAQNRWDNAVKARQQAYLDHKQYDNFELRKQPSFSPAQEHAQLEPENMYNFEQDSQATLKQNHQAKLKLGSQDTFEPEFRANLGLRNKDRFEQNNQASHLPDYHQADLNWDQVRHQPDVKWGQVRHQRNWKQGMEVKHAANLKHQSPAIMPQGQSNRQQRAEVTYHQSNQQWQPHPALTRPEEFKKMEPEPVVEKPAPLERYERHQLSRIGHQKRSAEMEKQSAPIEEGKQIMAKHDEPQPVSADLPKQETHLDGDSFIANSARDPPRYMIPMQNDFVQSQNDPVERRLNEDRSLSEGLNLDKLTGEKEPSPADWESDNKRGKRENRETDDAPENSKETYLKKLMDSFPRDQGGQINANVALTGWRFSHLRIKRSLI